MKRREQKKKDDEEAKRSRMRKEFDSMSKELEVAGYAKGSSGQLRRVVPRKEAQIRSKKRKLLEQQDAQDYGILEDNEESRMRGSQAASEDHVIQGSRIFQNPPNAASEKDKSNYEDFAESEEDILDDDMGNEADDGDDDDGDYVDEEEKEDDDDSVKDDIKGDEEDEEKVPAENNDTEGADDKSDGAVPNSNAGDKTPSKKTKKYKKRMYRLRNFQSLRMAQQHGDALEAHARGQPKVAIEKLKQVARLAPSAPQIYSSLGMVYEDMLKESRKRSHRAYVSTPTKEAAPESEPDQTADDSVPDSILTEQLSLAEKAYGSYHIAALLCKKDFTLWVRAADSATVIAEIHRHSVTLLNLSAESRKNHKSEVKRWQSEALRDFKVADNLKPPGIDVPAKLASMQIEMGNLSEALTILTDLKNRKSNVEGARSEFQSSYKAWQLYSDLMLRIGHECIQWNRGIHKNDNYMFRRWLRKLSKVFDWQERRLQALSLALEAAAGTKSTEQFMVWMRQRAISRKNLDGDENADKDRWHLDTNEDELPHKEDKVAGNTAENSEHQENKEKDKSRDNIVRKESADGSPKDLKMSNEDSPIPPNDKDEGVTTIREEQFEADKLLLLDKNRSELEAFDKTTTEMSLGPESIAAKERETTRNILLESHKTAVAVLIGDYKKENFDKPAFGNTVTAVEGEEGMIEMHGESLPMSASCRQVCAIASELIKHLHGLELYTGARLVGEAVSLYLKDRAAKSDRRKVTQKRLEEWQEKVARSPFIFEPFDKGNDSGSDDEASPYLSDEEELDSDENLKLLGSLRRGALPPELRILFGLALIGEGGRNFVAAKCIEAIDELEQEPASWLSNGDLETKMAEDPVWYLFRRAMTEPLGRTAAYAYLADVLRKAKKEQEWTAHFAPWFRRHIETLKSVGLMDQLLRMQKEITLYANVRKIQLLKIILASNRFDIVTVDSPTKIGPLNHEPIVNDDRSRIDVAASAIKSLASLIHLIWKTEEDGSLPSICTEVVKISCQCLQWFSQEAMDKLSYSCLKDIVEQSRTIVSFLCGKKIPEFSLEGKIDVVADREWVGFPIDWAQPEAYRPLSLRTYNLIVGCNVALFSGWEPDEFTLRLLRRRHGNKHFGVHFNDRRVAGILSNEIEDEVCKQWDQLATLLPLFPAVNFSKRLAAAKSSDWYKNELESRQQSRGDAPIARYAEEDGVRITLAFSALCLHLVASENDKKVRNRLLQIPLSVLLPISQFCLDDTLWGSDIGEAASTLTGFDEWRLTTGVGPDSVRAPPASTKTPRRRKKSEKAIEKKVQEWIKGTGKPTIRSFVALPTNELRKTWRADIDSALLAQHANDQETQQRARECMQKVHKATQQLRACYTEMAMEKASIQVTIALLELASQPACYDPFVCLQQAAMYASQAPKAGNSDMAFRHSLPEMEKCTPIEALNALGRADCLHSVYFPNEAAFLCSYVAKVCRLYRDREQPDYEWNGQWKVVAIYAFNVSVMIRTTVSTVLDKTMQKSFLSMWERDVVEELERGRSDGMLWKRSLYQSGLESDLEEGEGVEEEGGHEEEELGGNVDDGTDVEDENGVEEEEQYEGEEEERHAQHVHSHDSSQNNPLFSEYNIHDYGAGFAHSMSSEIAHDPGKSDEDSITGIDMVPV